MISQGRKTWIRPLLITALVMAVSCLTACSEKSGHPELATGLRNELAGHLEAEGTAPVDYILGKFKQHDVIFIGELHRIRQNLLFVQEIIPRLHDSGVYTLCTEFARREDQPLIDSLVTGADWDETLAREITFRFSVRWGFREYVDVFRAAWALNASLGDGERKFRVLGLNDSPDWSRLRSEEDRDDSEVMKEVWKGGGEKYWAETILGTVIAQGEKALVYSGIHHAFTEYLQPICRGDGEFVRFEDTRMGNHVFRAIGKRAVTVFLHGPWKPVSGYGGKDVYPADGVIDALIPLLDKEVLPVAFDTRGTPFGTLPGKTSIYSRGYEDFRLQDFCDGYIVFAPFSLFEGVAPIEGFINEGNLERARSNDNDPRFRNASVERFNRSIAHIAASGFDHLY